MKTPSGHAGSASPYTFFVITFVLSWSIWIPLMLSHFAVGPLHIADSTSQAVRLLGVLMPAVTAIVLSIRAGGRIATRQLLRRILIWRVNWRWWMAGVAVQPILLVVAGLVASQAGWSPDLEPVVGLSAASLVVNAVFLLIATLGEEIGWRGWALPVLQERGSRLGASLILGTLVASWHVPFWLLFDTWDRYGLSYMGLNYVFVIAMTIYITWLYNHARRSLLIVAALHVTFNIVNVALLEATDTIGSFAVLTATECLIALILLPALRETNRTAPLVSG